MSKLHKLTNINLNNKAKSTGFTLLEIIISLGMMSFILLSTTMFIQKGGQSWAKGDKIITSAEYDRTAINFIRKMMVKARSIDWTEPESRDEKKIFIGKSDSFYFASSLPDSGSLKSGMYLFGFLVSNTKQEQNPALMVSFRRLNQKNIELTMEEKETREVVLNNVSSFNVQYFGIKDKQVGVDEKPEWNDEWISKESPLAIKISLKRVQSEYDDDPVLSDWDNIVIRIANRRVK